MKAYLPEKIESKWQKTWKKSGLYSRYKGKKPFYVLDMFPYPSGAGLHVGHPKGFIATDVVSRMKMMQGFSVVHPMGWDAFGLPAENYAIKNKIHPAVAVKKNIQTFKKQLEMFGFTYDWNREINTTDPEYYKWTQWIFIQMYKKGLAYESNEPVNWCPSCKTVLANEDLENGKCERCGTQVEQKKLRQWVLRMTKYADRLLYDLDNEHLDWEDLIKEQQKNWIGRSEGTQFKMFLEKSEDYIEVYTTRLDTVFGMTYAVVAPEHSIIEKAKDRIENYSEVKKYILDSQNKTNLERTELQKEKTGVALKGLKVINPFNQEAIPLYVADYVLGSYGTGAVMAVPAHDERDFEFAKKHNIEIRQTIAPNVDDYEKTLDRIKSFNEIFIEAKKRGINLWLLGGTAIPFYARVIYRACDDLDLIAKDEDEFKKAIKLFEELGFKKISEKRISENLNNYIYKRQDLVIDIGPNKGEGGLTINDFELVEKSFFGFSGLVLSRRFINKMKEAQIKNRRESKDVIDMEYLKGKVFIEDGFLVNSEKFSGLSSSEARKEMTQWLKDKKLGQAKVNYKMRDWVFSRQRYWGEPIPIIHCEKCGIVSVPENELPIKLPNVKSYEPSGTGESPLAKIDKWVKTKCPQCGGPAKRETNTMPQWAGSCWYYLAYLMKGVNKFKFPIEKYQDVFKKWLPVDLYVGGQEHATRHLLYARFWHKFLYDIKAVPTKEPFKKLVHVGLINASDGRKMSKRWGNVINPDDMIKNYGADALRTYEMFMGPFVQSISWNTQGMSGAKRFLEKVWKLQEKVDRKAKADTNIIGSEHRAIKKVSEDIEAFRFNTAISTLMIFSNELEKLNKIPEGTYETLIKLLAPFAPHVAEELWEILGHKTSIFLAPWSEYNPSLIQEQQIKLVVQINGKLRDLLEVPTDIRNQEAETMARKSVKIKPLLDGKQIKKVIFVPGKLINFVV